MKKKFVEVIAHYNLAGEITPLSIIWEDGRKFAIDRVTNVCRAASLKSGGQGWRFSCRIRNREFHLFLEEERFWFLEDRLGKN
ncbi:MAG: hypothetical protein Q8876_06380 [Bacillota bacterium]|nr:hypothetical protein [Bacillota bacterium]